MSTTMQAPIAAPNPYDLTGKVQLTDRAPKFTGTYSWVFKGTLRGKAVYSLVHEVQQRTNHLKRVLGCCQGHTGSRRTSFRPSGESIPSLTRSH